MGATDTKQVGYGKSQQKKDWAIYRYCGGSGGGGCPYVQNKTQIKFAIEVNPYLVKNNSITLRNPQYFGIQIFQDLGPDGFGCSNSYNINNPQDWYLGLSADGVMTDAEVIAQNQLQDNLLSPFDIEVTGRNILPQPTDAGWDSKIWCHIVWTNPLYVSDQLYVDDTQYLKVVQHNYEVKQ
jgi:hypothetical protein